MRCRRSRAYSGPISLIDRAPINPPDPIAHRAAVARSEGQGRRPVFRATDTASADARPENVGRRRSLALGRSEHDGRLTAYRDGGARAAVRAIMAMLTACAMMALSLSLALADPPRTNALSNYIETIAAPSDQWGAHIVAAAERFAIPERWIRAVMRAESDGDPLAVSPKGAMGLMQIMPATWVELRERHGLGSDPYLPRDNILAGAAYLAELHELYGSPGFLAAYNAGLGRYEKHLISGDPLPAETVDYVAKIVPMIDAAAAIATRTAVHPSRSQWADAPLFVAPMLAKAGDDRTADDLPSGRPSNARVVVDLSALTPPSDGLFVHRSQDRERRR